MRNDSFRIAVMPGDGIGHEVIEACLPVLNAVTTKTGGFKLDFETWQVGALSRPFTPKPFLPKMPLSLGTS